jgi:hypothetical protein
MNVKCGAINCNYKYKSLTDSINHIKSTHPDIISNLKQRDLDWNKFIEYLKVKGISSVVKIIQHLQDYANGKIHINNLPHEHDGKPFPQMETYNKYLRNTSDQLKKVLKGGDPLTYYWCPSLNITSFDKDMPCDTDVHKIKGKVIKGGKKTRGRKKKGGILFFPPVIPVSLGYYLYQTKMNGKKAIFNWPVQYKSQDPVTKGGKRSRKKRRKKRKRTRRRRRRK